MLWIGAVENNIGEKLYGFAKMLTKDSCIVKSLFFACESIKFASYPLQSVDDLNRSEVVGSLESHVFTEMSQSLFTCKFIACSGSYCITAINHLSLVGKVDYS